MKKSHDTIAQRLVGILMKFNNGERFTTDELAEEFDVTPRTIQRDINERLQSLPIIKENGYYRLEAYALGKLSFRDIVNFAAISGVRSLYPSLTEGMIVDLLNERINRAYLVKQYAHEEFSSHTDDFSELTAAIVNHQKVSLTYNARQRVLNPYKMLNNNGIWYLVADESGEIKHYGFSKISNFMALDETFAPERKFVEMIERNDLKWFTNSSFEVTLKIDGSVSEYFLRRDLFPNQQIIEHTDEALVLTTKVAYDEEILGTVKFWLPHICILSPRRLHEKLQNILKDYLETTQPVIEA